MEQTNAEDNHSQCFGELTVFLESMARMLVKSPEAVEVKTAKGQGFIAFEVMCKETDAGGLIGIRGKNAEAIRTILMAAGSLRGVRTHLQIISRHGPRNNAMPTR